MFRGERVEGRNGKRKCDGRAAADRGSAAGPSRFAELYERNFERVYAYIAHRVRDRDLAEDLTAEVLHQALATLGRFEWRGIPFAAWLVGIAAHVIATRYRSASANPQEVSTDALELLGGPDRGELGGSCTGANGNGHGHTLAQIGMRELAEVEQRALISQLVAALPDDQRLVITRRFLEHRSIRDIAHELGRSEGAVKQLQFRALANLRARMNSNRE